MSKSTYTITEKQNSNSIRKGVVKDFKNLTGAKIWASRNQVFQGTVLVIEQYGNVVAKKENEKWINK